jgi:hypothetical protein
MNKVLIRQLFDAKKEADKKISAMDIDQRTKLEEVWDVEHAYYSSALEGSNIDKKEFEELAEKNKK